MEKNMTLYFPSICKKKRGYQWKLTEKCEGWPKDSWLPHVSTNASALKKHPILQAFNQQIHVKVKDRWRRTCTQNVRRLEKDLSVI